jgi:hypothetical protein
MTARYELGTAPPARRALAERLPIEVARAAAEFITGPLRWPASISARRTYLRSVSAVPMPSFLATAQIAAYCEG